MKQRGFADIILIAFGLFITVFLVGFFRSGNGIVKIEEAPVVTEVLRISNLPYFGCGITINSPEKNSYINKIFEFSGETTGCGWNQKDGIIGVLQIFDDSGNPLTESINIPVNQKGLFKASIALKRKPVDESGYINFQSLDGSQRATFNIYFQ